MVIFLRVLFSAFSFLLLTTAGQSAVARHQHHVGAHHPRSNRCRARHIHPLCELQHHGHLQQR